MELFESEHKNIHNTTDLIKSLGCLFMKFLEINYSLYTITNDNMMANEELSGFSVIIRKE